MGLGLASCCSVVRRVLVASGSGAGSYAPKSPASRSSELATILQGGQRKPPGAFSLLDGSFEVAQLWIFGVHGSAVKSL
jgi:hypothetical protein